MLRRNIWKGFKREVLSRSITISVIKSISPKNFASALQMMQSFGEGNPAPKFLLSNEQILFPKDTKVRHVTFQIQTNGYAFAGIGFHMAESIQNIQWPIDLIFQFIQSWFRGKGRDQVQALHFIPI
jgi:single-stranded DNA-specific DHH superfamily exonuclease